MTTEGQVQDLLDRVAALQGTVVRERLADELIKRPDLGDALVKKMSELLDAVVIADNAQPVPVRKPPPSSRRPGCHTASSSTTRPSLRNASSRLPICTTSTSTKSLECS